MNAFSFLWGITRTTGVLIERAARKAYAPPRMDMRDPVRATVAALHPSRLSLIIDEIIEHSGYAKTFRLVAAPSSGVAVPLFRAGQYLSIKAELNGSRISRPYSISSAPFETKGKNGGPGYYEITVKHQEDGYLTPLIWERWKRGSAVEATGPHGEFYHEPIRDGRELIAIAGGSGITPFLSMARQIVHDPSDTRLTVLYGIRKPADALFADELGRLSAADPDRLRVCYVVSEPDGSETCATGFIDAALIAREVGNIAGKTFLVCGPQALYAFFTAESKKLKIAPRYIRWEASGGGREITAHPHFPTRARGKTFNLTVQLGRAHLTVPARADEPILVALERSGIAADSRCRSGSCGICRSLLVSGDVFIDPTTDVRRRADREFGYIHGCSTYPVGDCEIKIPLSEALTG
jgi:ferredoxin-NADP reductase